jgi:hypothetical protein
MGRLIKGGIAMFRRIALVGTVISASTAIAFAVARNLWRSWGIDPREAARELPGDELVTEPGVVDTRGIDIAAPPEQVWPWLVQMGYKRAGWYSYDAIDMNQASIREIMPEFQELEVGQVMPTHPGGGFVVKIVEPGHALVVYQDSDIMREQGVDHPLTDATPNVQATGKFMGTAVPGEFAASWAFVLESTAAGGTRLIERFRARFEAPSTVSAAVLGPVLGFGVFAMTRRQMLGIRDRAEALLRTGSATPESGPLPA